MGSLLHGAVQWLKLPLGCCPRSGCYELRCTTRKKVPCLMVPVQENTGKDWVPVSNDQLEMM